MLNYKVLFVDVKFSTIIYTVFDKFSNKDIKVFVEKENVNQIVKKGDLVSFDCLFMKNLNEYKTRSVRKVN